MNQENSTRESPLSKERAILQAYARELKRARLKPVGPLETAIQRRYGRVDARRGAVRCDENGEYTSAHIQKELDAYSECCDRFWGTQQIQFEWAHVRCSVLIEEIRRLEEEIERAKNLCLEESAISLKMRRRGEELLSEEQIVSRRKREIKRKKAAADQQLKEVTDAFVKKCDELAELFSFIEESDNSVRLICERVESHTRQRIGIYWREVCSAHPDAKLLPPVIKIPHQRIAEQTYLATHRETYETVAPLLKLKEKEATKTEEAA